jgi:hypothetical protein
MTHFVHVNPLLFEPGDRLSLDEFLELWEKMPALKFAELIEGVVYMPSPLSYEHGRRDAQMQLLLGTYAARTSVCEVVSNATWLMLDSAPQPDIALRLLPQHGGNTNVTAGLASGSPELIVEVARSSRSFDLGPKLALYQRAGVREYIAVLIEHNRVEWRILEAGNYRVQHADPAGVLRSLVFPGLWLDETALWAADPVRLLAVLEQGLDSAEYRSFMARFEPG